MNGRAKVSDLQALGHGGILQTTRLESFISNSGDSQVHMPFEVLEMVSAQRLQMKHFD